MIILDDGTIGLIIIALAAVPYFFVCRLLWHVGSWFKNHK